LILTWPQSFKTQGKSMRPCARWRRSFTDTGGAGSRLCGTHKQSRADVFCRPEALGPDR
jgi:hypothetical protein